MLGRLAVVASLVSTGAVLATASPQQSRPAPAVSLQLSSKGDRLSGDPRPHSRHVVASVTSTAKAGEISVTMRDRSGRVLYRSDADTGVTIVSRNVDLAELPVGAAKAVPSRDVASAEKGAASQIGKIPVGCERAVSALTRSSAARVIGRCLT